MTSLSHATCTPQREDKRSESLGPRVGAIDALSCFVTRRDLAKLIGATAILLSGCDAANLFNLAPAPTTPPAQTGASELEDPFADTRAPQANTAQPSAAPARQPAAGAVVINGQALDAQTLASLEAAGAQPQPGNYWYDNMCGAWGYAGQGTSGFVQAGLGLGGPLAANASAGNTDVFVNGRELPQSDLQALQRLGPVDPGRYWLDGNGNWGFEGGPTQGNLVAAAKQANGGSGDNYHHSDATGVSMNSAGGSGYIMGDGWSVSW